MRSINTKGLQIIEEFEGLSLTPYICPAGVPTIGIGTTRYPNGDKVKLSDPAITPEQAIEYLKHDLKRFSNSIEYFIEKHKLYIGDNKFSALVSFAYNVGTGAITTPGKTMYHGLIENNDEKIKKAFLLYTKVTKIKNGVAKKIELPGLVKRRRKELELFFS